MPEQLNQTETKITNTDLFLPSSELEKQINITYPWEEKVDQLVKENCQTNGRLFDNDHLIASKRWGKILSHLSNLPPKEAEMITFACLTHDIGYQFPNKDNSKSLDQVRKQKNNHAIISVTILSSWYNSEPILKTSFNQEEWTEILNLVKEHDQWDKIRTGKESSKLLPYVFAADTLAQIDIVGGVKPTFDKKDLRRYVSQTLSKRFRIMKPGVTKQAAIILINRFMKKIGDEK